MDGIQVATGCTMGKDNIRLEKGDLLKAKFTKGNHHLRLSLKAEIFYKLLKATSKEESKHNALKIVDTPIRELFEIE